MKISSSILICDVHILNHFIELMGSYIIDAKFFKSIYSSGSNESV